jgi:plastocyanin
LVKEAIEVMAKKLAVVTIVLILAAILAGACSSGGSSGNTVSISGYAFNPASLNVSTGTTVTWTNNDSVTHTVTSDTGAFSSGDLSPGQTFSYTFSQAGTFAYHCSIHASMHGTVTVKTSSGGGY